jgi:phage protein D
LVTATVTNATTAMVIVQLEEEIDISNNITWVEVEDNDRLIDKATFLMNDPHGTSVDVPKEGLKVTIGMGWVAENAILFQGIITKVTTESKGTLPQLRVVALDPSYQMMLETKKDRHTGKLSKIIEDIVSQYGIPTGQIKVDPDPTFDEKNDLKQGNKKDWEFIQKLAVDYHARAYVEYTFKNKVGAARFFFQPEKNLLQGERMGTLHYCHGFSEITEFKFERVANNADAQRSVTVVNPLTGNTVTNPPPAPATPDTPKPTDPDSAKALAKISPTAAANKEQAETIVAKADVKDQRPKVTVGGQHSDVTLPERVGKQDPTRILGLLGKGTAIGTVMLRAKGKVGIVGIAAWAEGDWYVKKAIHTYTRVMVDTKKGPKDQSTYRTKFEVTR